MGRPRGSVDATAGVARAVADGLGAGDGDALATGAAVAEGVAAGLCALPPQAAPHAIDSMAKRTSKTVFRFMACPFGAASRIAHGPASRRQIGETENRPEGTAGR